MMLMIGDNPYWTRRQLGEHVSAIGLQAGDAVMVHTSMRSVGPVLNGPDALIGAILDVIGPNGTLLCYVNWDQQYEDALDDGGRVPEKIKSDIPPFDAVRSRASRDHGVFAEFVRTTPGALRSSNPGASVVAIGGRSGWFTASHPLHYGYGPGSPFEKLVSVAGKILMVGAPADTMSVLHYAEHLAQLPGKHIRRMEVPLQTDAGVIWHMIEEFDTVDPIVDGLDADYFGAVVAGFLATNDAGQGLVGSASSVLLPAADLVSFAVQWLEQRFG